jgi:hypothetical protein
MAEWDGRATSASPRVAPAGYFVTTEFVPGEFFPRESDPGEGSIEERVRSRRVRRSDVMLHVKQKTAQEAASAGLMPLIRRSCTRRGSHTERSCLIAVVMAAIHP